MPFHRPPNQRTQAGAADPDVALAQLAAEQELRYRAAANVAETDDQDAVEHDPPTPGKPGRVALVDPRRKRTCITQPRRSGESRQSKHLFREKIMLDIAFI
jgi:hypothetical protein